MGTRVGAWTVVGVLAASVAAAQVEHLVVPADVEPADEFGCAMDADGDLLIVGAYHDDAVGTSAAGSAYVFARDQGGPGAWGLVKKVVAPDASTSAWFGLSVAIDGDTAVVGAPGAGDAIAYNCGQAYIFRKDQGGIDNWGMVAAVHASDATDNDEMGHAIAIDGDTLVVGADRDDDGGLAIGSVYIFERNQGGADAWGEVDKLQAPDGAASDHFGGGVAIDGDLLAIGAYGDDNLVGSVSVWQRGAIWSRVTTVYPSGSTGGDWFGESVALDGDTLAVGAAGHRALGSWSGAVFVYRRDEGGPDAWGEVERVIGSGVVANTAFGSAVALAGDLMVVGAEYFDGGLTNHGRAYVFERDDGGPEAWGEVTTLEASDAALGDWFGRAVATAAGGAMVGSLHNAAGAGGGAAYVYDALPPIFRDGFESGGVDRWSATSP